MDSGVLWLPRVREKYCSTIVPHHHITLSQGSGQNNTITMLCILHQWSLYALTSTMSRVEPTWF